MQGGSSAGVRVWFNVPPSRSPSLLSASVTLLVILAEQRGYLRGLNWVGGPPKCRYPPPPPKLHPRALPAISETSRSFGIARHFQLGGVLRPFLLPTCSLPSQSLGVAFYCGGISQRVGVF